MIDQLNDVWRYRVNDSTWTWMSGNNTGNQQRNYNDPGARSGAIGLYDSLRQELWLFGGSFQDSSIIGE